MKKNQWWQATRTVMVVSVLSVTTTGCSENEMVTRPAPPAAQITTPQAANPNAEAILKRMAEFLAKTQQFSVNLNDNFDVVQESGQKIEFGETRKITISRPNGLRVELEESNGEKHTVLYDGKDITVFSPSQNVYAQTTKPGGIDEAVRYFLKDLHMRLPLAALLLSRFPAEVESRTQSLDYVEKTVNRRDIDTSSGGTHRNGGLPGVDCGGRATVTTPHSVDLQECRGATGIQGTVFRLEPGA